MIEHVLSLALLLAREKTRRVPERSDVVVTGLVMAVTAAGYLVPGLKPWDTWRFMLEMSAAFPLLWRRRYPIPVGFATGTIALVISAIVHPSQPFAYAVLVSEYTIAAETRGRMRVFFLGLYVPGNVLGEILHGHGHDARDFFTNFTIAITVALLGILTQSQRDFAAATADRAATAERSRIARDMHDVVGHAVALMVVQAEAGPLMVRAHPEKAEAAFDAISEAGRDALAQLRRLLGVLKEEGDTAGRTPQPTLASLDELVERVRTGGLAVNVAHTGTPVALPADVETAAYRVVQEALTNTLKHAGASRADVLLDWTADALRVTVADDGRGVVGAVASGHGLIGLRERVAAVGGTLNWNSPAGSAGFALTAYIPSEG